MSKKFYITNAIPYVNARPHIGHAFEIIESDVLARYHRLIGDDTRFLWGTDDNSLKNLQAAEKEGVPIKQLVEKYAQVFKDLARPDRLNLSFDDFIQTSNDSRHLAGAQKLWRACFNNGDIYKKQYKGLYCVGCEQFYTQDELINSLCPEHKIAPDLVEEENYFFRLSRYADKLCDMIKSGKLNVIPDTRRNEMLAFISRGLEDFSISRSAKRARDWGMPVPDDADQIMYVWFDALSCYINGLDYGTDGDLYKKYWLENDIKIHLIGKGITRFHSIYWPAMLLSAGEPLPSTVLVHGYITSGGQKMSKSIGNVIDPTDLIKEYGTDAVRYILVREVDMFEDSDLTKERIREAYNANLANGLGNLASRTMKLAEMYLTEPQGEASGKSGGLAFEPEFTTLLDKFEIQKACDYIWQKVSELDQEIQRTEPFKLVKIDLPEAKKLISQQVVKLYTIAHMLTPILPATSQKIKDAIKTNKSFSTPLFPRKD